tara:strand:+ start:9010 stop:14403 length:5394 start_codon:yes stop_codon:yes gene_type:complete
MASNDIDIRVLVSGEDQLKNLSASLRNLTVSLNDGVKSTANFDARQRALNQALGNTGRGLNQHAKSAKQAMSNQRVLGDELRRTQRDLRSLQNLANKGFNIKGLNQTIAGLQQVNKQMRGIKARTFVSDMRGIGLEMRRVGKDLQFVGRSLIIGLTAPLLMFSRRAVDAFKTIEKEQIRLAKITDLNIDTNEQHANTFDRLTNSIKETSQELGIQQSLLTGVTADFAQLGIDVQKAGEVLTGLTELSGQLTILGDMDVSEAKELVQTVFLGTQRALETSGRLIGPGEEFANVAERQVFALKSVRGQMFLFNAIENTTALSLRDLATAMPEAGAAARFMGLNFTETAALLAPMKAAGFDVSESANGLKISLQRMVAPTIKAEKAMAALKQEFNDPALSEAFDDIGGTGIKSIQGLVDVTARLKEEGAEAVNTFYKELFQGRQGPRMATAAMDMVAFQDELRRTGTAANDFNKAIQDAMDGAQIPDLPAIDTIEGISTVARIAASKAGEEIDSLGRAVTQTDIDTAKMVRREIIDKMEEGLLDVEEIGSESGKALMINFLGAANAQAIATKELDVALASTSASIDRMKVAFTNFAAAAVEQFAPFIEDLSVFVQDLVRKFEALSPQTKKIMAFAAASAAALGPLVFVLGQMKLAAGVAVESIFRFVPGLKTLSIESVATNTGLRRMNTALTMQGNTIVNTNGRFKTFIATLAGGSGPIGKIADKFGVMTGILSKTETIGSDVATAMTQMSSNATKAAAGLGAVSDEMMADAGVVMRGNSFADATTGKFISHDEVRNRGIPLAKDFDPTPDPKRRMAKVFDPLKTGAQKAAIAVTAPFRAMRTQFALTRAAGGGFFKSMSAGAFGFSKSLLHVTKVMKLLKIALVSTGIGAILIGIGALIAVVVKNFDKIKDAAGNAMGKLSSAFEAVKRAVMAIIRPFVDLIASLAGAGESVGGVDALGSAFESVAGFIEKAALKVEEFVVNYVQPLLYHAMSIIGGVIKAVGGVFKAVVQLIDVFRGGGTSIGDVLNTLLGAIKALAKGLLRPFAGPLISLVNMFGVVAENIINAFIYAFEGITRGVLFVARLFPMAIGAGIRIAGGVVADFVSAFAAGIDLIGKGLGFISGGLIGGESGLKGVAESIRGAANNLGNSISSSMDGLDASVADFFSNMRSGVSDFTNGAADSFAELINSLVDDNDIKGAGDDLMDGLGESVEDNVDEVVDPLVDTFGDGGGAAGDAFAKKFAEALKGIQQKFVDLVGDFFSDEISNVVDGLTDALEDQRDAALAVFDDQIDVIDKLEKAEISLTKQREFEANKRKLLDERELNRQNFVRNRALAIYEGRVDDARMLDREEQKSKMDSASQISDLEQKRNEDLRKENLDFLKDSIKDAKKEADKFFKEQIAAFKEASKDITKFAPQTIEDYEQQLTDLTDLATQFSDDNAVEFAKTFDEMRTKINTDMPNKVVGVFGTNLDTLITTAKDKYGLDTVDKGIVGATVSLLTQMGDAFSPTGEYASSINTNWSSIVDAIEAEITDTGADGIAAAIEDKGPQAVLEEAIKNAEETILNEWRGTVGHIISEVDDLAGLMDPMIENVLEAQMAFEALEEAANAAANATSGIGDGNFKVQPLINDYAAADMNIVVNASLAEIVSDKAMIPKTLPPGAMFYRNGGIVPSFANGGRVPSFAPGGYMTPGFASTPIPAVLHGGEFVLNRQAVQNIGMTASMLTSLNKARFRSPGGMGAGYSSGVVNNTTSTTNIYVENFIGEDEWFNSMVQQYDMKVRPMKDKQYNMENRFYTTYKGASY